mmetsp:Transcript_17698/g.57246  ORF Transcript_17698/g.57246 Transcript_17698/m.57246 type:complete len:138 (+) Transcript_17698:197-610(+)
MGKAPNNKNKGTKGTKFSKTLRNKLFLMRGVDQVWEDVRKEEGVTDGKTFGPLGTTTKGQLDEDIPGYGKFYCIACRCGDLTPPPTLSRAPTPRGNAGAPPRCLLAGCPGVPRGRGAEAAAHVSPRARLTGVGCATQ